MNDKTKGDRDPADEDRDYIDLMDRYEDTYDPRNPWCLGGYPRRDQFVNGLRQLADLLATRLDLPIPKDGSMRLDVIRDDGGRVAEITFGPVSYRFAALPAAFERSADFRDAGRDATRLAARDTPSTTSRPKTLSGNPIASAAHTNTQRTQHANAKPKGRAR